MNPTRIGIIAGAGLVTALGIGAAATWTVRRRQADRQAAAEARTYTPEQVAEKAFRMLDTATVSDTGVREYNAGPDGVISRIHEEVYPRVEHKLAWYRGKAKGDTERKTETPFQDVVRATENDKVVARHFLKTADANNDGTVTLAEFTDTVRSMAGSDGKVDYNELRAIMLAGGMADLTHSRDFRSWAAQGPDDSTGSSAKDGDLVTVSQAVNYLTAGRATTGTAKFGLPTLWNWDDKDGESQAMNIGSQGMSAMPRDPKTTPIWSIAPSLAHIEAVYGNGNGLLSTTELGAFLLDAVPHDGLPTGLMRVEDVNATMEQSIRRDTVGFIDATRLDGGLYANGSLAQSIVDADYGGNLADWLESTTSLATRWGAEWVTTDFDDNGEPIIIGPAE